MNNELFWKVPFVSENTHSAGTAKSKASLRQVQDVAPDAEAVLHFKNFSRKI